MKLDNSTRPRAAVLPFDGEATMRARDGVPTGAVILATDPDGIPVVITELRDTETGRTMLQRQRIRRTDVAGVLAVSKRVTPEPDAIDHALELMKQEVLAGRVHDLEQQRKAAPRPMLRPRRPLRSAAAVPVWVVVPLILAAVAVGAML